MSNARTAQELADECKRLHAFVLHHKEQSERHRSGSREYLAHMDHVRIGTERLHETLAALASQAEPEAGYHAWCGDIDTEATLRRAASVMQDVLTDIADWEDKALAEAVTESRRDILALADSIAAPPAPAQAEQSEDGRDAARSQWLGVRERFASVCVDFDSTGTYSRHRIVWHDDKEGWRSVEGQSFAEAVDAALKESQQ